MIGTFVNVAAILTGSILGLILKGNFSSRIEKTIMQGMSLAIVLIGLQMGLQTKNVIVVIVSLVIGGMVGELVDIEKRLHNLGEHFKRKLKSDDDFFVQGFVHASLVFCVGAMAIMGSIQDGLNNDPTILFNKSILDGIASVAFASTFGIGVILSAISVFIYQGSITFLASWAQYFLTDAMINEMTATGGLLIMAIGINMLGMTKIKVGNLLPSLVVAIVIAIFFF